MSDWIEWNGGEYPVEEGTLVDVKYRDGEVATGVPALRKSGKPRAARFWGNRGDAYDIIAYRLHRVSEAEKKPVSYSENPYSKPLADLTMDAPGYESLGQVLMQAYLQAAEGKGAERHADSKAFDDQPMQLIQQLVGPGFALGQAIKKCQESQRMDRDAAVRELLGAIVYIAGAIIHIEE